MSRGEWRPWRFSLRFLLLLTAVIAAGAAFVGWRDRQLEPQRRAVARIEGLGGSVQIARLGWSEAIARGCAFEEVVSVDLPGQRADDALPALKDLRSLREVTLRYRTAAPGEWTMCGAWLFSVSGNVLSPQEEHARCARVVRELENVEVSRTVDNVTLRLSR